jgi:hypothetical protein
MAPLHVKRKFWWELIFIGALFFLLTGVRSQRQRDAAATAQTSLAQIVAIPTTVPALALARAVEPGLVITPVAPSVLLQ